MNHPYGKNVNKSRRSSSRRFNGKNNNSYKKSDRNNQFNASEGKYQRSGRGSSTDFPEFRKYEKEELKKRDFYQSGKQSEYSDINNKYSNKSRDIVNSSHNNRVRDNNNLRNNSNNKYTTYSRTGHKNNRESSDSYFSSNNQLNSIDTKDDLIWGRHASQAALETGRPIHRIWCTSELRSSPKFFQLLRDSKTSGVLLEEVSWARLGQITNGNVHQGIALQTAAVQTLDLKKLIRACSSLTESPLLLALDGLTDPHNVGAIVRSAEAFGAHGLVLPQRRSAGLTGSVAKVAAGALEHLPVARVVNLNRSLLELKKVGYKIIGLAEEGTFTLQEVDLNGPLVVVIGSEDKGLSVLTRKNCDHLVRIPLRGLTPSLNASIATSIVLYEIARNTWMKSLLGQAPSPQLVKANISSS
tara:strand:- start:99 stop:1337 length:1239 start_codon:yes stop_codon:yes gene_type:complete